jgi:hypothetical protein
MKKITITEEMAEKIIVELQKVFNYEWNDDHIHADKAGIDSCPLVAYLENGGEGGKDEELPNLICTPIPGK